MRFFHFPRPFPQPNTPSPSRKKDSQKQSFPLKPPARWCIFITRKCEDTDEVFFASAVIQLRHRQTSFSDPILSILPPMRLLLALASGLTFSSLVLAGPPP